ncbi:AAA family ATPase [Helicobacter pylori]|uniref:AAA family ATPase n=1 Tax=Helicobacter pylori TaxID=210 RepID=UPI002711FEB7|nr:ATP-binding protein [Helicobacter pylori]MDO7814490.1 ATP-binding protein [Helicobacter pylori]MDO7819006.1 ATP-binding protein [Helicobacter pylori]MDO7828304.1 ATP-binding protein [Helicobacter pylori]MDO7865359.1 ATP-binding protein [Helicobacter pylori]WQU17735.1 ATP-binding protein [Helicobacter pylori]
MEFYRRVLKLHHFRNLGKNSPTELLLNSSFGEIKHGELVVLVGENNVGKSNVLEALKIFNDADVKLCSEEDYFKNHEKDSLLSLEEETILDHKITDFSCVDLRIQSKEVSHNLKELSKTLIVYPFSAFIGGFIKLVMSYGILDSFLKSYKEKLKLSAFATRQADNLLFKKLIKHLSGNNQLVKNFCQCIREIIKYNAPNKEYKPNQFFIIGKGKQKQLAKIYAHLKELSASEIKPQDMGDILKKLEELDKIFKTTDFTRFTPKTEIKDIIKEIDEKYPINENFKRQFNEFESNIKKHDEIKKDFERNKESLIREIENHCKNECNSEEEPEYKINDLLKNIQQICKNYIESHAVNDVPKDIKYMMCQFYLKQIDLLVNSEIVRYRYSNLFEPIQRSLWESIKILDNESGIYLFPKNIGEIKDKFEANKEKFKQSKNYYEFAEYCRECNPYTAFNFHLNINNGLSHQFEKFVPIMKEYKEPKITDNDLEAISTKETGLASQLSGHWFFQLSLFNKTNFNPNKIWIPLEFNKRSKIKFDKDLEIYFDSHGSFNISKKYLQERDQESLKKIKQSKDFFPIQKIESKHDNNDILQLEFFENDTSFLFAKGSFAEILEYNMQLKIDSLITKEFNRLLAIAEDSPQDSYQLKIRVRHNNKFYDYSKKSTAYEIKLEIHDCRKSDNQNEPIILSQQSTGFQWAFNFMFGFLYNVGSHFSLNKNIIYVMDEPATHLSVPARKEFRKFLKEYAHKNHVTFVLATHDPFLVDTDHLDEIRIVEKETEDSAIKNSFNYPLNNASKDSDALDKIKRSLGVGQHVFHNPQKHRIIFVEGITDYCYLSAFKLYFNKHNPQFKDNPIPFTFLPISGLKNNPNKMKETIKKLCELDNNPIVLTDDDRKCVFNQNATSERFKRANEDLSNPITILQLSDCDRCFKQIEDCFSANDRNKYAKNKRMELAMAFKTRLLYGGEDAIEKQTKRNFLKLFKWIAWATNLIKN